jgi:uncharacterized Zn finger protein (UPF0148 family)
MAHRDLDAALQLLAERAHYITGASGAAIALRRGQHNDMLCRASAGSNAPDLGAILSMDYGLSGESVRTRQLLRCDDAEHDPRVNHEVCRQLGIASVVVMPIVSDQQVLGVFELLSGEPSAFGERDLSALRRLSQMVERAVKYAVGVQIIPASQELVPQQVVDIKSGPLAPDMAAKSADVEPGGNGTARQVLAPVQEKQTTPPEITPQEFVKTEPSKKEREKTEADKVASAPSPKKPLFWSAAVQAGSTPTRPDAPTDSIAAPPALRNLQKCEACGFPVSQGRTFCVDCEDKKWRGQRMPQRGASGVQSSLREAEVIRGNENSAAGSASKDISAAQPNEPQTANVVISAGADTKSPAPQNIRVPIPATVPTVQLAAPEKENARNATSDASSLDASTLFMSSAIESQSWLSSNKYILGALALVAIVIGVIAFMR